MGAFTAQSLRQLIGISRDAECKGCADIGTKICIRINPPPANDDPQGGQEQVFDIIMGTGGAS